MRMASSSYKKYLHGVGNIPPPPALSSDSDSDVDDEGIEWTFSSTLITKIKPNSETTVSLLNDTKLEGKQTISMTDKDSDGAKYFFPDTCSEDEDNLEVKGTNDQNKEAPKKVEGGQGTNGSVVVETLVDGTLGYIHQCQEKKNDELKEILQALIDETKHNEIQPSSSEIFDFDFEESKYSFYDTCSENEDDLEVEGTNDRNEETPKKLEVDQVTNEFFQDSVALEVLVTDTPEYNYECQEENNTLKENVQELIGDTKPKENQSIPAEDICFEETEYNFDDNCSNNENNLDVKGTNSKKEESHEKVELVHGTNETSQDLFISDMLVTTGTPVCNHHCQETNDTLKEILKELIALQVNVSIISNLVQRLSESKN